MKPRVVLDTNILLDLFYFAEPSQKSLHEALIAKEIQAFTHRSIWEEFEEVLARKPFNQSLAQIATIKQTNAGLFEWCTLKNPPCGVKCIDPDDQIFVELSVELTPCYLITKDTDLLRLHKRLLQLGVTVAPNFN
jgi:putative PIN family toxin of toxin-antitoxin system